MTFSSEASFASSSLGSAVPPPASAPGKRTRTQGLTGPGIGTNTGTGIPLVEKGMACDDLEEGTPGCLPTVLQRRDLLATVERSAAAYKDTQLEALTEAELDLLLKQSSTWNGWKEVIYLLVTTALIAPLSAYLAGGAAALAAGTAAATAIRTSVNVAKVQACLMTLSRGLRTRLAHPPHEIPATKLEFVRHLKQLAIQYPRSLADAIVENELNDDEVLAIDKMLNTVPYLDITMVNARIEKLLADFEANRIGEIGKTKPHFGGLERALPVRVRLRRDEYLVLCESFGLHNDGQGLNGANTGVNAAKVPMTMESLVFVRLVEPSFAPMMMAEYQQERHEEIPFIDFNTTAARRKHRWFGTFSVETLHHDPKKYRLSHDLDAEDAFEDDHGDALADH